MALMSLDDRVLHLPGMEHGVARCGEVMRDPWQSAPTVWLQDKANELCPDCFDWARP